MVYRVGNMLLQVTQELFQGKVNDVIVCQDIEAVSRTYYTVLVIKDHDTARRLLEIYDEAGERSRQSYVNGFSWQDQYLMIYDYQPERPIDQFFHSTVRKLAECEKLCANIIMECISEGIPWPVLYLQLAQNQIHIRKDGNVSLGYNLNLAGLSGLKSEKDCATLCAQKIFFLLEQVGTGKATSYRLLELKNQREGYSRFLDLYRDMQITAVSQQKEGPWARITAFFRRNQDRLFKGLLVICIAAALVALIMLLSQLIFADIPFFRLFVNTFKQIGTESLLQ